MRTIFALAIAAVFAIVVIMVVGLLGTIGPWELLIFGGPAFVTAFWALHRRGTCA
jgi:hypothetical protein